MESKKEEQPQPFIIEQLQAYIETRIKLAKYKAIDKGSALAAGIIADVIIAFSLLLAFVFASITLALFLAHVLNSNWAGFGCVTLIYALIGIGFILYRKAFEKPIVNAIIKKFFK